MVNARSERICLQMVAVISLSILFNIPRYLDDHVVKTRDGSSQVAPTDLGSDDTFKLVYGGLLYYVVIYALPIVILAAMTYRHSIFALLPVF